MSMTLYETIYARRSVRQYNNLALNEEELNEIKRQIDNIKQIAGQSSRFEITDSEKLKGGYAPNAILVFDKEDDTAFINIGFCLQGIDLWLQSVGYGSIWCGMVSPKVSKNDFRILLGFGKADIPIRKSEEEFKRKKISDISNKDNSVARAARIAPSAVNFQPWKLNFEDGKVIINSNVRGISRIIPGRFYLFDLGIVAKHVEIALENDSKTVTEINVVAKGKDSYVEFFYKQ